MALLAVAILLVLFAVFWNMYSSSQRKLPPGPWGLPIIGSLHMLGNQPHRNLSRLANKYGPIMFMRLGSVPTIVMSSPEAAKLVMKTHDAVFASCPKLQAYEFLSYGATGVAFTAYGPYWRSARKLCTLELFSNAKVNSFASVRREAVGLLVKSVKEMAAVGEVVDISANVAGIVEDLAYRMVFGDNKDDVIDLKTFVREATKLAGTFNLADYVPSLGPLDLQGLTRLFSKNSQAIDEILEKLIDKHIQNVSQQDGVNHTSFIDVMLSLMNKSTNLEDESLYAIDRKNVKAIILDMLVGGIDSSITSIEWVLSELLKHPRVMKQLQEELRNVVGTDRMVEETDLKKLDYLNKVVKETLRLHPIGPFLVPRESMEDIVMNGYFIPKKSIILINTWAIGRDPNVWSKNVEEFFPERFAENNIDLQGHDFELTPFGSGRRGCPGLQLGLITVGFVVSQLVHCFNWELPNGMQHGELDMKEKFGLTMPRAVHLVALPTYRLSI